MLFLGYGLFAENLLPLKFDGIFAKIFRRIKLEFQVASGCRKALVIREPRMRVRTDEPVPCGVCREFGAASRALGGRESSRPERRLRALAVRGQWAERYGPTARGLARISHQPSAANAHVTQSQGFVLLDELDVCLCAFVRLASTKP